MRRDGAARRCAPSPRRPRRWCASTRAPTAASTATACARGEWIAWQFGPRLTDAFEIKDEFDPRACSTRARSSTRRRWTTRAVPLRRRRHPKPDRASKLKPVLDWSAWNVQNDPVTESHHRAGHRRRPDRRLRQGRRDVQQQRPLPQVRRRHHVPELPRHARRAAPDARPRQHAAPGAVGPARAPTPSPATRVADAMDLCVGCKGCKRDCPTGVDMAR
jgi:ferredoxin